MEENQLFVTPYSDSENNNNCLVVCKAIPRELNPSEFSFAVYIGNINLDQRYFIKGDKTLVKIVEYNKDWLKLEKQEYTYYCLNNYAKENYMSDEFVRDMVKVLLPPVESYRYEEAKPKHSKIQFF